MLLPLLLPALLAAKVVEKDDLLLVDDIGFLDTITSTRTVLAEFYAPWCGHCKRLVPEFEKAAKRLKTDGVKTIIIDGSVQRHVAVTYGVIGYPTLFVIVDGQPIEYHGDKKADAIIKWVRAKSSPQAKEVFTVNEVTAAIEKHGLLTLLFAHKTDPEASVYETVIRPRNGTFLFTESQEVLEHYQVTAPRLVLLKKTEEKRVDYDGEFTVEAVGGFVSRHSVPWLLSFSAKTSEQVFYPNSTRLFFFRLDSEAEKYAGVVTELVERLQGSPTVVVTDLSTDLNSRLAELFGVNPNAQPYLMLYHTSGAKVSKYIYSGEKTVEGILGFLDQYRKNDLTPYFKTEDPPKDGVENGVKVLVGKTFPDVALEKGKTVLVNFYAPWCGHCFMLNKEIEKVADHFHGRSEVVIAKLDASMNELPDHVITTYPQLKLFNAVNKAGLLYEGERKAADIISFLETHLGKK